MPLHPPGLTLQPLFDFSTHRRARAHPHQSTRQTRSARASTDESMEHLTQMLHENGMELYDTPGDGVCVRRAVAVSIAGTPFHLSPQAALGMTEGALRAIREHYDASVEFRRGVDDYVQSAGYDSIQHYCDAMRTLQVSRVGACACVTWTRSVVSDPLLILTLNVVIQNGNHGHQAATTAVFLRSVVLATLVSRKSHKKANCKGYERCSGKRNMYTNPAVTFACCMWISYQTAGH
jgi:hypothetical protein